MLPIHYTIRPVDPHAHLFEVNVRITEPAPEGQRLLLPALDPRQLHDPRVRAPHRARRPRRSAAVRWRFARRTRATWIAGRRRPACAAPLVVSYEVYAWDLSVRAAHLDADPRLLQRHQRVPARGGPRDRALQKSTSCAPRGAGMRDWRVATTLPRNRREALRLRPLPRGQLRRADRPSGRDGRLRARQLQGARRLPHDIVITGRHRSSTRRACAATSSRSAEAQIASLRAARAGARRCERYLFLTMAVGDGYGGLEHRASHRADLCSRDDLPAPGHEGHDRRLPDLPRPVQPRVLPHLERQAHQARRVRALRPAAARPTRAAVGVRGLHLATTTT